jgi:ATP/maltotriose-dependent transcriptional regulator MalT
MAGLESRALADDGCAWNWRGPLRISPRLLDVVESSMGALDEDELAVLEAVAQSEPLEARFLERWYPGAALHSVERRGLIATEHDGRRLSVRLTNPLHGHLLRERTPELRARALRRQLADELVRIGARRKRDPLRIAISRLDAGGGEEPELMLTASRTALEEHDHPLAERLARAAIDADAGAAAELALSCALHAQDRHEEAMKVIECLEPETLDEAERAQAAALRAQTLSSIDGEIAAALHATHTPTGSAAWQLMLAVLQAAILLVAGEIGSALQIATDALDWATAEEFILLPAALTAGIALAAHGRSPLSVPPGDIETGQPIRFAELVPAQHLVVQVTGGLDEAASRQEHRYRSCLEGNDHSVARAWSALLGRTELDRGRVPQARHRLNEAAHGDPARAGQAPMAWLAEACAVLGDVERAESALAVAESARTPATALFDPDLELARAWLMAARGDLTRAAGHAERAAEVARRAGNLPMALVALHTVVRLGGAGRVASAIDELAGQVDGPLSRAYAAHAAALADGSGPALDRVAEALRAEGALLLAAEASAEAVTAYYAMGRRGRSQAAGATAHALLQQCGGVRTPALIGLKAPALTQREREVAMLAAQGQSSRGIASQLGLSVRTVDNHLQMAYGKLGINGRRALADALDATHSA